MVVPLLLHAWIPWVVQLHQVEEASLPALVKVLYKHLLFMFTLMCWNAVCHFELDSERVTLHWRGLPQKWGRPHPLWDSLLNVPANIAVVRFEDFTTKYAIFGENFPFVWTQTDIRFHLRARAHCSSNAVLQAFELLFLCKSKVPKHTHSYSN